MNGPAGSIVMVEANHDLPLVQLAFILRAGAGEDPVDKDGLANFAAELMARGAAKKTRAQLDAAFDALGATLHVLTDHDSVSFQLSVLRSNVEPALKLLSDILLRPDFVPADPWIRRWEGWVLGQTELPAIR